MKNLIINENLVFPTTKIVCAENHTTGNKIGIVVSVFDVIKYRTTVI